VVIRKHLRVLREWLSARSNPESEHTEFQCLGQMTADAYYMVVRAEQDAAIASARYLPIAGEPSRSLAVAVVDERKGLLDAVDGAANSGSDEKLNRVEIGAETLQHRLATLDT
jgi:hypothetical protein